MAPGGCRPRFGSGVAVAIRNAGNDAAQRQAFTMGLTDPHDRLAVHCPIVDTVDNGEKPRDVPVRVRKMFTRSPGC